MLPDDSLRGQGTPLIDEEAGVGQRLDAEPVGRRLAGNGQPVRLPRHRLSRRRGVRKGLFLKDSWALDVSEPVEHTKPGCAFPGG